MNESKRSIRLLALLAATLLTMATVFFAGSATNAWAEDPAAPAPAGNHIAAVQFSLIGYASGQTPTSVQVGSQTDKVNVESKKFFQSDPNASAWTEATGTFTHDFKYRVKITFSAKAGYDFDGLTAGNIKLETGETAVEYDVATKTATFDLTRIPANHTLTFNTNGGSAIQPVTEPENTDIDLAAYMPTKEGFKFAGWYADEALTQKMDKVTLGQDTTVYAKWTADTPATPDDPEPSQPDNPGDQPGPAPMPQPSPNPRASADNGAASSAAPGSHAKDAGDKKPHGNTQTPVTGSHSLMAIPMSVLMTAAGAALLVSRRRKAKF